MCVCGDWSMLEGLVETIGGADSVGVPLTDTFHGPDRVLLQQIASRWEALRAEFGDALLPRLSGIRGQRSRSDVWDALALVASQDATLQQELEDAVIDDPGLLSRDGVLAWFVTREGTHADAVAEVLVSHLSSSNNRESLASVLVANPKQIGLGRDELQGRLENALRVGPPEYGDAALEALAVLFPSHPVVRDAWRKLCAVIASRQSRDDHPVHARTYFAVALAAAEDTEVLAQIEDYLGLLDETGATYYDEAFTRHVSNRLGRDATAANMVRDVVLDPTTTDSRAALFVSLLADALGLDEGLLSEIERRIVAQNSVRLAPLMQYQTIPDALPVKTIFMRVADSAWDVRST